MSLQRYADIRRHRYRALGHFWRFGRGWLARVDKSLAQALSLDDGHFASTVSDPPSHVSSPPIPQRKDMSLMPDAEKITIPAAEPDAKWWGNSLTIWGTLVTAISTVAPAILSAFGLDVPGALIERLGSDILAVAQAVGGLVGTTMAVVGRSRAALPLTRRPVSIRV
jgi:lysozyme family protein